MSSNTILIGPSIFWCGGKNPSTKDIPGSALSATVVHKTLKILPRGVNLCLRKLSHFNDRAGQCRVV